jgi:hypothetical protein
MKSGILNFLEPSGPLQACNGTALSVYVVFNRGVNEVFALVVERLEAVPVKLRTRADNIFIIL